MSSREGDQHLDIQEQAFKLRMVQHALSHRINQGIDPLDGARFQQLGFFEDAQPVLIPDNLSDVLRNPDHPDRLAIPPGPLLFFRENGSATVIEIANLFLQPNSDVRCAALEYLVGTTTTCEPWLTPRTAAVLTDCADFVRSAEEKRWRAVGIEVAAAILDDYFSHCAGARQSLVARYQPGIDRYLMSVMRPRLRDFLFIRPPLWNPREQLDELTSWMEECATRPTLEDALTEYTKRCGYLPLRGPHNAASIVHRWQERHPGSVCGWDKLWSWAVRQNTPSATYHAVAIAVSEPSARPTGVADELWLEVQKILDSDSRDDSAVATWEWRLFCELGSHFTAHIEALRPGQNADRIGCYAWWVAERVHRVLRDSDVDAKGALLTIVGPETDLSFRRWTIARSAVGSSTLRSLTLQTRSVWAISLVGEMRRAECPFKAAQPTGQLRESIAAALQSDLVANLCTGVADGSQPLFAFEDNTPSAGLGTIQEFIPAAEYGSFTELIAWRDRLLDVVGLQTQLSRILDLPSREQLLTLLYLNSALNTTSKYDDAIAAWAADLANVKSAVERLPPALLERLLEVLIDFQQRQWTQQVARLPHMLAYVIENGDDIDRAKLVWPYLAVMSINSGLVSPIQRMFASKWRSDSVAFLARWREGLRALVPFSEPWVKARVRATSTAISRLIGPQV